MPLNLLDLAAMSCPDFQKIVDAGGKINPLEWFKNSNLFYGLQEDIRNLIYAAGV